MTLRGSFQIFAIIDSIVIHIIVDTRNLSSKTFYRWTSVRERCRGGCSSFLIASGSGFLLPGNLVHSWVTLLPQAREESVLAFPRTGCATGRISELQSSSFKTPRTAQVSLSSCPPVESYCFPRCHLNTVIVKRWNLPLSLLISCLKENMS